MEVSGFDLFFFCGDRFELDAFVHNALFFDGRGQVRQVTVIRPFSLGVAAMAHGGGPDIQPENR